MYVFYLPVNRLQLVKFKEFICLTEVTAAEEAAVGGKRTRMRGLQYQMFWIIQHGFLILCRTSPQHKNDWAILLV